MSNFKKFYSRKCSRILCCNSIVTASRKANSDCKDMLIIHTANGIYQGTVKSYDNDNHTLADDDDVLTIIRKLYLSELEEYSSVSENTVEITENPLTIDLENVTLVTSGRTIDMPFASIFVDQIIGISAGHIDINN